MRRMKLLFQKSYISRGGNTIGSYEKGFGIKKSKRLIVSINGIYSILNKYIGMFL